MKNSKFKIQQAVGKLKRYLMCHPERSEGSFDIKQLRFFTAFRMTDKETFSTACQEFLIFTFLFFIFAFAVSSCGYRFVGSRPLTFNSITIKPVKNNTFEPKLEERMHIALSNEFINQGIEVKAAGGNVDLESAITTFALGAIGAVGETIKEQEVVMRVDLKLISNGKVTEFKDMASPIKITFQTTGTVSQSVANKEGAADKACREIAKEIVSKIIIQYAK